MGPALPILLLVGGGIALFAMGAGPSVPTGSLLSPDCQHLTVIEDMETAKKYWERELRPVFQRVLDRRMQEIKDELEQAGRFEDFDPDDVPVEAIAVEVAQHFNPDCDWAAVSANGEPEAAVAFLCKLEMSLRLWLIEQGNTTIVLPDEIVQCALGLPPGQAPMIQAVPWAALA